MILLGISLQFLAMLRFRHLQVIASIILLSFAVLPGCPANAQEKLEPICVRGEYAEVIEKFKHLPVEAQQDPANCYVAAYAYMRRRQFLEAEPLVKIAQRGGFHGYAGWTSTEELFSRIVTLKQLCPPLNTWTSSGHARFDVYGPDDEWCQSIYSELPTYIARAREAFGDPLPSVSFYLFNDRAIYEAFYKELFETGEQKSWQAGTGNFNVVVFCKYLKDGSVFGASDLNFRRGAVLHELGHALSGTICGDCYYKDVPNWLDEGLADMVARPYLKKLFADSPWLIAKTAGIKRAPTYEQMCRELYLDPKPRYALARLFTARLMDRLDVGAIGRIVRSARTDGDNFEAAVQEVTGADPAQAYRQAAQDLWKR